MLSEEDKNALDELKLQQMDLNRQIFQTQHKIENDKKLLKRSELTGNELADVPETCVTYKAVGRMFLMTSIPEVKQSIKDIIVKSDESIRTLNQKEEYLQRQLLDNKKALQEVITKASKEAGAA